jgi:hypothetical protein
MTIRLANTISGTTSSNLLKRATLALALLAGASSASAQDQFRFGNSSVGRVNEARSGASSRDSAASRSTNRGASRIDSLANSRTISRPTFVDRAPSFNRTSANRLGNSPRDMGRSDYDRGGRGNAGRSAIDPDGDGIGMRNPGSSRDRDGKNDWSHKNDKNRHGYDGRKHWDDDDNFRLRVSLGSSWSSCSYGCGSSCSHASYGYGYGYGYSGNVCGVNAYRCGGCSSCLGWSGSSVVYSSTSISSGWVDPWSVPYVEPVVVEPVVVVPQTVVQPVYVVQQPLVVYATTDVSNAILAADSGAHARGITLMRAYAAQQGRLPDNSELGPAARAALENVWRFYERAALAPGANADTFFMLGACRALRGDRALATDALDAVIARGDTDPSASALRAWCAQ